MCGICGIVGEVSGREEILERMMRSIEHRGPDGEESYVSKEAALGFRRLSIIDLDTGMQPMFNEDGSRALVFNGEIYNYRILREMLVQKGHTFKSVSDSEVILHGYEEFGTDILPKLRGMFGFAVWDEGKKELFAARDFFGIKPFYYAVIGKNLVFASEIKSILEYPGYKRRVNEEALEQYLSFQYSVLPETFFKGIFKLMPGHYLTYKNRRLKVTRYFEPSLRPENRKCLAEELEEVRHILKQSVARHLVSDVDVGSFLSGGVDSGLVAALSKCGQTFTVGFEGEGALYDETSCAKRLSDSLGTENYSKVIKKDEFGQAVPEVMYYMDEPSGDASAVALYLLSKEAAGKVKVVLSGEGADEVFGGYNIYLEPGMLRYMGWLPFRFRKVVASLAEKLPRGVKGRGYLMRAACPVNERYIGNAYVFHEEEKCRLLKRKGTVRPAELLGEAYDAAGFLSEPEQMQFVDLKYWLPGDILQKADKMSMAHSLEVRVPFLDKDVFEVARHLPQEMKVRRRTTKYILREAASECLPESVSSKRKLGFPVPIRNWLREEDWYDEIRKVFMGEASSGYFHTGYLLELLERHRAGKEDNSRKIWTVYAFLVWHRIFFETEGTHGRKTGGKGAAGV